jgi:hypothetical protein
MERGSPKNGRVRQRANTLARNTFVGREPELAELDMKEKGAAAMADKYWMDVLIRHESHFRWWRD